MEQARGGKAGSIDPEGIFIRGERGESRILFGSLGGLSALVEPRSAFIVADELTIRFLPPVFASCPSAIVPRGEAAKSLPSLEALYGAFLEAGLSRDGRVVAIGGGSVCDLAGLAASTWMRGVRFGLAPTTLLSMVDASVGGKNAIDFHGYKNLIGTFAQPSFVLMDCAALDSLPDADLSFGLAEAVKHAVIDGEAHLAAIEAATAGGPRPGAGALPGLVALSVRLKASIASGDEREEGGRMRLNLGHTIGHALESAAGMAHGAGVAIGLASALRLALALYPGKSLAHDAERVIGLLHRIGLPTELSSAPYPAGEEALRAAVASALTADKKRRGDDILFALPRGVGSVIVERIPVARLQAFVREAP